jgi:diadenosine tetraphosphate (Ap4A) HIT family hydrolase
VVKKLQNTFKEPEIRGFNFISNMNDENIKEEQVTAYQSVHHFHLHIIPRYAKNEGFI